jgi:hypothetical protein
VGLLNRKNKELANFEAIVTLTNNGRIDGPIQIAITNDNFNDLPPLVDA